MNRRIAHDSADTVHTTPVSGIRPLPVLVRALATALSLLTVLAWISPKELAAQDASPRTVQESPPEETVQPSIFALSAGLGVATDGMISMGLSGTLDAGPGHLVGRLVAASGLAFFGPSDNISEYALLYGVRTRDGSRVSLRGAAGLGLVRSDVSGDGISCSWLGCESYEIRTETATGLALEAGLTIRVVDGFHLALSGFGNVNSARNLTGATLGIQIGG